MKRLWRSRTVEAAIPDLNLGARPAHVVRSFQSLLGAMPITVVDAGARGGLPGELEALAPFIDLVAFEPDIAESQRLTRMLASSRLRSSRVVPAALGPAGGCFTLHVTREPGRSSLYAPDQGLLARYGDAHLYDVVSRAPVSTVPLAGALEDAGVGSVDLLKLDLQGFELPVLETLDSVRTDRLLFVECEVEFAPIYVGQPTFRDLDRWLVERGFELFHLSRTMSSWGGRRGMPYGRGQLLFGDAHYLRTHTEALDLPALAKLILLAVYYGYADYAAHVAQTNAARFAGLGPQVAAEIERFARPFLRERAGPLALGRTALRIAFDKILFQVLRWRRWNGLKSDSDRSYPTR